MPTPTDDIWPPLSFQVFAASGRHVGYGHRSPSGYEIYFPGGEGEGWCGSVDGGEVTFSSGEIAGRVTEDRIFYSGGGFAGTVEGLSVFCEDRALAGRVTGEAPPEAVGGAVLLLILNRWFDAEGKPNPALAEPNAPADGGRDAGP